MYEAFFGLRKRPFSATPDATCFFAPEPIQENHDELLHRLENGQGISILTGEAGTGKTLLLRKLVKELQPRFATVFLGTANFPTRRALLQAVLYELGQRYSGLEEQEFRLELLSHLKQLASAGRSALLLIDEAHLLSERLLEEIRAIADLSEAGQPLARVLLSGPLQLEEKLTSPALQAFNERITCHVTLEPLTQRESAEYVEFRLKWAGSHGISPFTPEALNAVAQACNGLPRCLNQLCDHSLLLAFVAENRAVTRDVVLEALADLKQLPLHWNHPLPLDTDLSRSSEIASSNSEPEPDIQDSVDIPAQSTSAGTSLELTTAGDDPQSVCFEVGAGDSDLLESALPQTTYFEPPVETVSAHSPRESNPVEDRSMISAWNIDGDDAGFKHSLPFERPVSLHYGESEMAASFEEEVVFDRYAQLDAGLDVGPGTVQEQSHPIPENAEIEVDDPVSDDIVPPPLRPVFVVRNPPPVEIIDEIIPLLQEALDVSGDRIGDELQDLSIGSEPVGESDLIDATSLDVPTQEAALISEEAALFEAVESIEQELATPIIESPVIETSAIESSEIEVPGFVPTAVEANQPEQHDPVAEDSAAVEGEVEEQLGAGVFDVCLDVQQEILGRLAPLAPERIGSGYDQLVFEPVQTFSPELVASEPIVYDVIEPELALEQPQAAVEVQERVETAEVQSEPHRPNYKRVFSLLRRRQGNSR